MSVPGGAKPALKLVWLVILAVVASTLYFADVYRKSERAAAESAARLAYFPLELESPVVYHVSKKLTRRVLDDQKPEDREAHDTYFSRLTLEPVGAKPGERRSRAVRSEKCATLAMALATKSSSKDEELIESREGVRLAGPGLVLVPPLTPEKPVSFSLSFGLTTGPEGFYGWPLLEVVGMSDEEKKLDVEPDVDRLSVFNVMKDETLRFGSHPGEEIALGDAPLRTIRVEYTGQITKKNVYHQIAGALWLAPKLGVVKEQRQVVMKVYPKPVFDPATSTFRPLEKRVVLFESQVTKLLAHPLRKER